MDRLSIFSVKEETKLVSDENNSLDTLMDKLAEIKRELNLTRKGHEEWTWGEDVEGSEDIDLEEIEE